MKSIIKTFTKLTIMCVVILAFTGCADTVAFSEAELIKPVGFLHGFWHGIIFPFAWLISLFSESTAVYAIYNNGGWYDFGFFLGLGGFSATIFSND